MISVERTLPISYCQVKEVEKRIPLMEKSGTRSQTGCDVMTSRLPDGGPAVRVRFRNRPEVGRRLDTRVLSSNAADRDNHIQGSCLRVDSR